MRFLFIMLCYGGIQFYVAHKVSASLGLVGPARLAVYAWALFMAVGPFLLWRIERCENCHEIAVGGAWLIYGWMGVSFLFFTLILLWSLAGWIAVHVGLAWPGARASFAAIGIVTLGLAAYGAYAAWHPRVERLEIESDKLPAGFPGLRLVQISDVHLGVLAGKRRLASIMHEVAALKPDILVSTGDLVDAQAHFLDGRSGQLASFQPRYGKFAVTGNHERYAGLAHAIDFHEQAGFHMLRGTYVDVAGIILAGVDDPAVLGGASHESGWLNKIPPGRFVILLKHQPVVDPAGRFDLQLSGHTHEGQIFPFSLLVRRVYPMVAGKYSLANGGMLYVSRGTGTWGPPMRLLAPAEITVIDLKRPAG